MSNDTEWTMGEVARAIRRIETKVDALSSAYVGRGEYTTKVEGLGREISELKARRVPGIAVAALIISGISPVFLLLDKVVN